jgi:hypothetical protein
VLPESTQEEAGRSSFSMAIAREVISIAKRFISLPKLAASIARAYQKFLDEHNPGDCVTFRSQFRIILWLKASENDVEIW